ncbi:MAG: hypothetical protein COY69_01910 [Candidatus Magasanikbacteria bacterium CG_4_10_14_0_8_um_filter_32_14]|uniref:Peptidase M43 pregnancy-associated plasma-A domain-containing protein n=2 Tax=Candidatus Magasanikiibacteriota TaxID=1752731 RepID=A0A2M7R9H7_9BACT|nr:MAG: hypothetical protein AUJ23_02045 [Candidatus Magasanikbacteria bacterium CG1_02_32_51]PIY93390.1 MAG: hypothetical protein COY69_01910 [Candidatus Magasanikbacteria bacterium CG_4_10_14_0_8_um_filter_32_14]
MKKIFFLLFTICLFTLFFINTSSAQSCPLLIQQAYKLNNSPSIYYVTENCTKRAFNKANIFFTYFDYWNNVKTVSSEILNSIPNDNLGFMPYGPKYDPKYGALIKTINDPKVYLLMDTEKYWITSENVFNNLSYSWNWIEDVDQRLLDKYQTASEINYTNHHPNYTLVKYANDPKVYRLEQNPNDSSKQIKRYIQNETEFNALGFRWDRIVIIKNSESYADTNANEVKELKQTGCQYNNPSCGSDYDCINNQCIYKSGCAYSHPMCGNNYNCVNNQCVLKSGCQFNNPVCVNGFDCINNQCQTKQNSEKNGCWQNNNLCNSNEQCLRDKCIVINDWLPDNSEMSKKCNNDEVYINGVCKPAKLNVVYYTKYSNYENVKKYIDNSISGLVYAADAKNCKNNIRIHILTNFCFPKGTYRVQEEFKKTYGESANARYLNPDGEQLPVDCQIGDTGGINKWYLPGAEIHELGHVLGLWDQYCYYPQSLNPPNQVNFEKAGCFEANDDWNKSYCGEKNGTKITPYQCLGNPNVYGGRTVMSTETGAPAPTFGFDNQEINYIKNKLGCN